MPLGGLPSFCIMSLALTPYPGRTLEFDPEMMRLQLLGNPELMRQIQDVCAQQPFTISRESNPPT